LRCAVDLLSQMVISLAEHYVERGSPDYPVGRARLEALGVIGCACIMSVASLEVVQLSAQELYAGFAHGKSPLVGAGDSSVSQSVSEGRSCSR
jgi:divalent metal cation (Fe/Co/Zn/Cd) transporter